MLVWKLLKELTEVEKGFRPDLFVLANGWQILEDLQKFLGFFMAWI